MRREIFVGVIIFSWLFFCKMESYAQQDPQYSHYMFQTLNYNPAFAGHNREFICANFLFHEQWTGFKDPKDAASPSTQLFNLNAPLKNNIISGAGLHLFNDKVGWEKTISFSLDGAYRRDMSFGNLAIGLSAGIIQKSIEPDFVFVEQGDKLINDINKKQTSKIIPDIGLGVYVSSEKYFVGLSALHLTKGDIGWSAAGTSEYIRHYYLTAGYNYELSPNLELRPTFLIKRDRATTQYEVNGMLVLQDKYWGGLAFRGGDAITPMIGGQLIQNLKVGYSFDIPISGGDIKKGGTHEVYISYCFKFKTKEKPPSDRIIWTPRFL